MSQMAMVIVTFPGVAISPQFAAEQRHLVGGRTKL
jgi:hypothetical protein